MRTRRATDNACLQHLCGGQMIESWFNALITLVVVIDPVGVAATYGALTAQSSDAQRARVARNGIWIAAGILFFFALTGNAFLGALGITIPAIRIAGGILLFILAIEMILARPTGFRPATGQAQVELEQGRDITVFPLAIPLIAGPGAITSVVLLMGNEWQHPLHTLGLLAVVAAALVITYATLRLSGLVIRVLGVTGTHVVGRVLGIVLASLAVQFVLDGLRSAGGLPFHP